MEILTGAEMREADRRTIAERGIPSLLLMEAAGQAVAAALLDELGDALRGGVTVVCGKGNNGGDGLVAARHLLRQGVTARVALLAAASDLAGDAATNLREARTSGVEVVETSDAAALERFAHDLPHPAVIVDAVLGTGARGGARGIAAAAVEWINRSSAIVVAVDLPSGLDADATDVPGPAVRATLTYTLCRPKPALVFTPAADHAGRWRVLPIGIPDAVVAALRPTLSWLDATEARELLPARAADTHKGTYGHLLAVAGSRGKSGAAVLVARGALRAGVGLVTLAVPASAQGTVAAQQAEVMTEALAEGRSGALSARASRASLALLAERDALAVGPGLGTAPATRGVVRQLLARRRVPTVLDADGLNAFAAPRGATRLAAGRVPLVITPHPGEASRLLGVATRTVQADRVGAARRLAKRTGAVVVLKGHRSLIARPDGQVAVNSTGNPGMATGGTGDVLTGVVGAFLARGLDAWDAARLATWAHGAAGDRARDRRGTDGMIASDLAAELPAALASLRPIHTRLG